LYLGGDERGNGNNKHCLTNKSPPALCPAQNISEWAIPTNPPKMQQSEVGCPSVVDLCLAGCPIPPFPAQKSTRKPFVRGFVLPGYRNNPSLASVLLSTGSVAVSGEPSRDKELGTLVGRMAVNSE